ncbi:PAS domain S-box-containing protein [Desulfitispora alkaliphila]|uniref:SpoIIE family protein phosphatase n=1 Tax=Desulfitispora alkaliphila TaxID=622674 RepID=UPI003D1C6179
MDSTNCIEKLRESEDRFRQLVESIDQVFWLRSYDDKHLLYISPAYEKIWGKSCESLYNNPVSFLDAVHKEDLDDVVAGMEQFKKTYYLNIEYRIVRPGGEIRWIWDRSFPIKDQNGVVIRHAGLAVDITDFKKTQEALLVEKSNFKSLFTQTNDAIVYFDKKFNVSNANRQFCKLFGVLLPEIIGKNVYDVVDPMQKNSDYYCCNILKGETVETETVRYHKNGTPIQVFLKGVPVYINNKAVGGYGIYRDITERKLAEIELAQLYSRLNQELDKARLIHERVLPKKLPQIPGVSVATYFKPAYKLGGDFYNVKRIDDKLLIYLSDVTGHGLDGALLSSFVHNTISSFISAFPIEKITPKEILQFLLDQFIDQQYPGDYFISIYIAVLDLNTNKLTYSCAGFHDRPLVQLGNGEQLHLFSKCLPISGALQRNLYEFTEKDIYLMPGTTIFFNTDGLTEQLVDNSMYDQRLEQVFFDHCHLSSDVIMQAVKEDFYKFNENSLQGDDDITCLVLQLDAAEKITYHWELKSTFEELERLYSEVFPQVAIHLEDEISLHCLQEIVSNGMEHGNKLNLQKKVFIDLIVTDGYVLVTVEDQGDGFDWIKKKNEAEDIFHGQERGRGIIMTQIMCDYLFYNDKGTKAYLVLRSK